MQLAEVCCCAPPAGGFTEADNRRMLARIVGDGSLGDWGDLFGAALNAGVTINQAQQNLRLATAQLEAQRQAQAAAQRRAAELQVMQQQAAQRAPVYDVQLEPDALPSWLVPAAIGGGVLLLVLLLRR